jgi:biopolymer transport protein ExbD
MRYSQTSSHAHAADVNIIPLADVLLVLLIIFMVTAPAATATVGMDLALPDPRPRPQPPAELVLRIDAAGDVYHQGALVPLPELPAWLRQKTGLAEGRIAAELPLLRIDASDNADYDGVVQVLAAAQGVGLERIGFVH